MTTAEIERMTPKEKLETIGLLWDSLSTRPDDIDPPAWHKDVLAARMDEIDVGTARFHTLAEVRRRLAL